MKNVGNSSRGRSQGVPKIFRAPMYRAHCAVIFAIAQLSCYRTVWVGLRYKWVHNQQQIWSKVTLEYKTIHLSQMNSFVHSRDLSFVLYFHMGWNLEIDVSLRTRQARMNVRFATRSPSTTHSSCRPRFRCFYTRQHASAYMLSPVRLSVCPSHGWISRKRV